MRCCLLKTAEIAYMKEHLNDGKMHGSMKMIHSRDKVKHTERNMAENIMTNEPLVINEGK